MGLPIIIQKTDVKFFILGEKLDAAGAPKKKVYRELSVLVHSSSVTLEIIGSYLNEISPYFPDSVRGGIEHKQIKSLIEKENILSVKGRTQSVLSSRHVTYTFCWVGNVNSDERDLIAKAFDSRLDSISRHINNEYMQELEMDLASILSLCYLFEKGNSLRGKAADYIKISTKRNRSSSQWFILVMIISVMASLFLNSLPLTLELLNEILGIGQ